MQACAESHGTDLELVDRDGAVTADGLSEHRLCTIVRDSSGAALRKSCVHCLEPSCVAACLVGGLTKTSEGPVVYDADKCIGCRYCMLACPLHVPRYEWSATLPLMKKCDLCRDRLLTGGRPACVESCPHDALSFGSRRAMLRLARRRIGADPARYRHRIWGELEWGGASVLYISHVDLAAIGFADAPASSVPSITDPVIHTTPWVAGTVAAAMTGLSWIVRRRDLLMTAETDGDSRGSS